MILVTNMRNKKIENKHAENNKELKAETEELKNKIDELARKTNELSDHMALADKYEYMLRIVIVATMISVIIIFSALVISQFLIHGQNSSIVSPLNSATTSTTARSSLIGTTTTTLNTTSTTTIYYESPLPSTQSSTSTIVLPGSPTSYVINATFFNLSTNVTWNPAGVSDAYSNFTVNNAYEITQTGYASITQQEAGRLINSTCMMLGYIPFNNSGQEQNYICESPNLEYKVVMWEGKSA